MRYKMHINNGYPLVEINGGIFLFDTGFPLTVAEPDFKEIDIDGFPVRPVPTNASRFDPIELATGMRVNGVIGFDTIKTFGNVLCDKANMTMSFAYIDDVPDGYAVSFKNDLHFNIKVNGKDAMAFLDTGAPKMIVDNHDLLDKKCCIGTADEPSFTGVLKLEKYEGSAEFGGVKTNLKMLKSAPGMMRDGSDVYFSPDVFSKEFYMIDWTDRRVIFK